LESRWRIGAALWGVATGTRKGGAYLTNPRRGAFVQGPGNRVVEHWVYLSPGEEVAFDTSLTFATKEAAYSHLRAFVGPD